MNARAVSTKESKDTVAPLAEKIVSEKDLRENFDQYQRWIENLAADTMLPYPALPEESPHQDLIREPVWLMDFRCSS